MSQTSALPLPVLEVDIEAALFGRGDSSTPVLDGAIVTFYLNERPLQGLAGQLDWRFHGEFSQYLKAGAFSGAEGECVYLPLRFPLLESDKTYHLLLIGAAYRIVPD